MLAYLKTKIVITLILLIALPLIILSAYLYMSQMSLNQGSLNINKITEQNKVYTYSVFSDFYFRATRYDETGKVIAMFSEVAPTEIAIGYDFKTEQPILQENSQKRTILIEKNSEDIGLINTLRDFSNVFAQLVATQDQYYLNTAYEKINKINQNIYGGQLPSAKVPKITNYYENLITLPIANLRVQPFKLTNITPNLKKPPIFAPIDKWQPNLIEYQFGDKDRVYFQYLMQFSDVDIVNLFNDQKNSTIVKTIGYRNNKPLPFIFKIDESKDNQIDAYFIDSNGYVYLLRYIAQNKKSFERFLPDFLKIAFSVYFVDAQGFKNKFAHTQEKLVKNYEEYVKRYKDIQGFDRQLQDIREKNLLEHFGFRPIEDDYKLVEYRQIKPDTTDQVKEVWDKVINLDFSKNNQQKLVRFDEAFQDFYNQFEHYPDGSELKEEHKNKKYLVEFQNQEIEDTTVEKSLFGNYPVKYIEDVCKSIACIKDYQQKNWQIE